MNASLRSDRHAEIERLLFTTYTQLDSARTIIDTPDSEPDRKTMAKAALPLLDWRVMELKVLRRVYGE